MAQRTIPQGVESRAKTQKGKAEMTRSGKAGNKMAEAIIETVNLIYQNNSAIHYLRELVLDLQAERYRREEIKRKEKQK